MSLFNMTGGASGSSDCTYIAPEYDSTLEYNTDDTVIKEGLLYKCLEDEVTGTWDSTKWEKLSLVDLGDLDSNLDGKITAKTLLTRSGKMNSETFNFESESNQYKITYEMNNAATDWSNRTTDSIIFNLGNNGTYSGELLYTTSGVIRRRGFTATANSISFNYASQDGYGNLTIENGQADINPIKIQGAKVSIVIYE